MAEATFQPKLQPVPPKVQKLIEEARAGKIMSRQAQVRVPFIVSQMTFNAVPSTLELCALTVPGLLALPASSGRCSAQARRGRGLAKSLHFSAKDSSSAGKIGCRYKSGRLHCNMRPCLLC